MNFYKRIRSAFSFAMAAVVCAGLSTPALAQSGYNDMEFITNHVSLNVPNKLTVTRPGGGAATTSASGYFIAGNSSPDAKLTMNGEEIATRGVRGSFGVFVTLEAGENTFVFKQGGASKTVTLTKGQEPAVTIQNIRKMTPEFDCATTSGGMLNLSCTAPSGASVTATVGGRTVALSQQTATAVAGVPATFSAKMSAGDTSGTKNLGPVVYTLNGQSTYESAGSVYVAGGKLVVQVKNNAASIYKDAEKTAFVETARLGAVDSVAEIGVGMYRLSSGGWVPKESVQPLLKNPTLENVVSNADFTLPDSGKGEMISLSGTSAPMYRAVQDGEKLIVKIFNTKLSTSLTEGLLESIQSKSKLFSDAAIVTEDGAVTMTLFLSGKRALWGYDVRYPAGGGVQIFAKYAPKASSGSAPLKGITIAVDAGHGGADPGAIGIPGTNGAMEKDITLANAIAVQKRLESLGATVLMCRADDSDVSMNARMTATQDIYADLFISIHCNSIGYDKDVNKIGGTEVYYFEEIAKSLASGLSANVASYTGRSNRGAKLSNYRVTLNSYAPSVLVEMGFLTNPVEYDSMTSRQGIFNTANAIGDSVLAFFAQ